MSMEERRQDRGTATWPALLLAFCSLPWVPARADTVSGTAADAASPGATMLSPLASKTSMLPALAGTDLVTLYQGVTSFTTVDMQRIELPVSQSGTFQVTLTDLLFPAGAATLSFALVDGDAVLGVINGSGSLQYSLVTSGPKTLFGYTYAVGAPGVSAGAYSLEVTYAPVPLPAAAWLLLSGLGLLGFGVRRAPGFVIRRSYN